MSQATAAEAAIAAEATATAATAAEVAAPAITGTTRLYAVLGDPVAQVQSPALLNPLFARLGLDAVLVPVHAPVADLRTVVEGLFRVANLDGLFATVPHKTAVLALADRVGRGARLAGGANALRREPDGAWLAENFDGAGFVAGLRRAGHDPAGRRVTLVGAGGAGGAIAAALLDAGVERLDVCDVEPARLTALTGRLAEGTRPERLRTATRPRLSDADLVVNATPLGLRPDDPLPFDPAVLPAHCLVADIIMKPRETPLLRAAAAAGLAAHPGFPMLEAQVDAYREFFGLDPATR